MKQHNTQQNNLHNKEECPACHFVFISGFDTNGNKQCPSCHHRFISGDKIDHGNRCSICTDRALSRKRFATGASNAHYQDGCPALMSDGRFITYQNSTNELTETMRKLNGIRSPNEFRTFMQNNGDAFTNAERKYIEQENTCLPSTACSEGWHKLWTKNKGNWANNDNVPQV